MSYLELLKKVYKNEKNNPDIPKDEMDNKKIEMTDNEIIKALICCTYKDNSTCKECPMYDMHSANCIQAILHNALTLIKQLKAENERLETKHSEMCIGMKRLKSDAKEDLAVKIKKELINEAKNRESCEQCQRDIATLEALELVDRVLRETIKNDFKE